VKVTLKFISKGIAFCLAFIFIYILCFGPIEAWVIRSRDYLYSPSREIEPRILLDIYTPLFYFIQKFDGCEVLASYYTAMWYSVRDGIDSVFDGEEHFIFPSTNLSNESIGVQPDSVTENREKTGLKNRGSRGVSP